MMEKKTCNCYEILEAIKNYSKGKATSRFGLAIDRCQEAIELGSPQIAIRKWNEWFDNYAKNKGKKKKPKRK